MIPLHLIPFENLKIGDRVMSNTGRMGNITELILPREDRIKYNDPDDYYIRIVWDGDQLATSFNRLYMLECVSFISRDEEGFDITNLLFHENRVYRVTIYVRDKILFRTDKTNIDGVKEWLNRHAYVFVEQQALYGTLEDRSVYPYRTEYISINRFDQGSFSILTG